MRATIRATWSVGIGSANNIAEIPRLIMDGMESGIGERSMEDVVEIARRQAHTSPRP